MEPFFDHLNQSRFLEIINTHFSKVDSNKNEIYILSDFIINIYLDNSCIFQKKTLFQSEAILSDIKKYFELCTMFGPKQLIDVPTSITCNSPPVMEHILANFPDRVSQQGVIDVGLSDQKITYWTRKISKIKGVTHK